MKADFPSDKRAVGQGVDGTLELRNEKDLMT